MSLARYFVVLALAVAACGGNPKVKPDASVGEDAGATDAGNPDAPSMPAPPALGMQIDRMGRAAISTALVGLLAPAGPAKTAQKDAYDHASDPATWKTTMLQTGVTIERELEVNLAVFDAIDKDFLTPQGTQPGCGNALGYSGPPRPTSYVVAADLFADDQLYVDTSKPACTVYLALEIEQASGADPVHTTCGGRMLTGDVIDVTYSVLASGLGGLDLAGDLSPRIHDGIAAHDDVTVAFPFLGVPH
jgi:hypothetical protein